jgi:predicted negative regulator of RcsB-dependent stress response
MSDHSPFIVIELLLIFGGAMAFAWWQIRDVNRAQEETRRAREAAEAAAQRTERSREDAEAR